MENVSKVASFSRNRNIDLARFFFALLVVVIHVPCFGREYILPIARCAVPFFYMVTGYFLYSKCDTELQRKSRIRKTFSKWLRLWGKYTFCLGSIVLFINWRLGNSIELRINDIISMIHYGYNPILDVIYCQNISLGTNVLWFLYNGAIVLILSIKFTPPPQKAVNKLSMTVLTGIVLCTILSYVNGGTAKYKFFLVSYPSILTGYYLHIYEHKIFSKVQMLHLISMAIVLLFLLYVEALGFRKSNIESIDAYLFTLPCAMSFMLILLRSNNSRLARKLIGEIPVSITLDIYVWHRLVYAFLVMIDKQNRMTPYAVILCYVSIFVASLLIRKRSSISNQ